MAESGSEKEDTSENQSVPTGNILTGDDPRFVTGSLGDAQVGCAEDALEAYEDLSERSMLILDEAERSPTDPAHPSRNENAGVPSGATQQLFDLSRTVSNRQLEKKLNAYGRRLRRIEEKIDQVVSDKGKGNDGSDNDDVDPWWDCPSCGSPTRVCRGPRLPTKRQCSVCDWSFTFPESGELVTLPEAGEMEQIQYHD